MGVLSCRNYKALGVPSWRNHLHELVARLAVEHGGQLGEDGDVAHDAGRALGGGGVGGDCPGQKPPFWAVKHPARPYRSAIENRCTSGNAEAA